MKHFFRGGEGMAVGQGDKVTKLQSDRGLSSGPKSINDRLLRCTRSDEQEMERSDEGGESLRTTFGLASPLLRPYITDSSRIQHRFNTSESRIVDEKVIKRCSGGNKTPKLVRSRYESDQEPVGHQDYQLSSSQVLPLFCLCSTSPRSGRDRAVTWLRSFIGASSQTHQSAIEAPSENGRTRLGSGRHQVGTLCTSLPPFVRYFIAFEAKDRQPIGKEQATNRQRTGKGKANKYQAKPKPSPEKDQGISRRDLAHTWEILRRYTKNASTRVAGSFGRASGLGRNWLQSCSTAVRELFESCSAVSRRTVEAVPNPSRSVVEDFPKSSRRRVEALSKDSRQGSRLPLNFLCAFSEHKTDIKRTGNQHKAYMSDTCLVHVQDNNDTCLTHQPHRNDTIERTKTAPERYSKGTGKVLNSGGKGTGEVLESYQIGTKELHADGRSMVGHDGDGGKLEKGGDAISFDSDAFKRLCETQIIKDVSLCVKRKTRRLRGLNKAVRHCVAFRPVGNRNEMERSNLKGLIVDNFWSRLLRQARSDGRIKLSRYDDIKRPKAYSLQLMTLLCVLFSSLVGVQAVAQVQSGSSLVGVVSSAVDGRTIGGTGAQGSHRPYDFSLYGAVEVRLLTRTQQVEGEKRRYPKVDFNKFPIEIFKVDADRIPKLQVGQLLPDAVLDMPLRVVNDVYGRDTVTLRSCMDRRWIILDIWSESCIPCLASMNHWEELSKTDQSFTLLGVYHSFYTHRAMPETRKKDYRSTQIIGPATAILSRLFLQAKGRLGPTVWIKDGRFFGVSEANTLRDEDYRLLLDGKLNAIPEYALW
ncbi:MAG: hypothetical protein LBE37_01315, partial [Sphingobacterium sp.]|nr:hypothetical protein [Sphingobacterium sp.]